MIRLRRRYHGKRVTPANAKAMREWDAAWLRCAVLARGIAHALGECYDAERVLNVLELIPGLGNAARLAVEAEGKLKDRQDKPKRAPKGKR